MRQWYLDIDGLIANHYVSFWYENLCVFPFRYQGRQQLRTEYCGISHPCQDMYVWHIYIYAHIRDIHMIKDWWDQARMKKVLLEHRSCPNCATDDKACSFGITSPALVYWSLYLFNMRWVCNSRRRLIYSSTHWCITHHYEYGYFTSTLPQVIRPGPRLNIKTILSTYGDFHVKDKTAVRTSYL